LQFGGGVDWAAVDAFFQRAQGGVRWLDSVVNGLWFGQDPPGGETVPEATGGWAWVPVLGSGQDFFHHLERGALLRAGWNGFLAATDVLLVRALAKYA
jgi:hypothetical protein